MFNAYCISKGDNMSMLDFGDLIWAKDVQPIAETMRNTGIKEFTISAHQADLVEILAAFSDLGIVVQGITRIEKWRCGEQEVPAFLMKFCDYGGGIFPLIFFYKIILKRIKRLALNVFRVILHPSNEGGAETW